MPESCEPAALAEPVTAGRHRAGRHRAGRLTATVLGLALLAAGAAACSSGGSGGDQKSGGSTPAAAPTGIQVPAKIASLKKDGEDPQFGTPDDGIPASVRKNLHTVRYADSANSDKYVLISGGPGLPIPADGSDDVIQRLWSEWDFPADGSRAAKVPPGSAGGIAECAPRGTDKTSTDCGWVNGKVALTLDFEGFTHDEARALTPKILGAMATS